jgi:hypothetical protein
MIAQKYKSGNKPAKENYKEENRKTHNKVLK